MVRHKSQIRGWQA